MTHDPSAARGEPPALPADNEAQIADWNGAMGERWASLQREIDGIVVPFGEAALAAAAAQPGERAIDIGCGCGDTSIALARAVGEAGEVLGVDVSRPMLAVADACRARDGWRQLAFREGDASTAELPAQRDLLFSRFGVMFFAQPTPAFVHLRRSLRAGGRCVFVCWRAPRDNAWAMTPLAAARAAVGITPPPADPFAPGPFAFADEERLRGILSGAGFAEVQLRRFDAPVTLGASASAAAENAMRVGPASRFLSEIGAEHRGRIQLAIEQALTPLAAVDGSVRLNGSTWVVSAANPA